METILVTGGAGFIGSHVCDALLEKGDRVICIDNMDNYYPTEIKEKNIRDCLKNELFEFHKADIRDNNLDKVFKEHNISSIIHLAAKAGVRPSIKEPALCESVNVQGTINLLNLCKEFKVNKFIFGSSSSVYGVNKKIPFSEDDETDNIISPYAATKKSGETFCKLYHNLYDINVTCLRFFTVYGPRGRPDMAVYKFTKLIDEGTELPVYGNLSTKRDYTFISDIVDGILSALNKEFKFEIINLGNSETIELKQLIAIIEKALGKQAKIKNMPEQQGDVPITFADISKAKKLLNYEPKVKIEEGIKRFIDWYKEK